MPGLYIHIPFCRQKCAYCAFYSVAGWGTEKENLYLQALAREAGDVFRNRYGSVRQAVGTLYMGGGTPSLLPVSFYVRLLEELSLYFDFSSLVEATFEANPEHLGRDYLRDLLRYTPFSRLSIGIQSFFDQDLVFLNRKHTGKDAVRAVSDARSVGFSDLSVDLIYGLYPHREREMERWRRNLAQLSELDLDHFSAYALAVEAGTLLEKRIRDGNICVADDEVQLEEFLFLLEFAERNGYEAYELSNFARRGKYAVHNTRYWCSVPYVGLGASAHSYFGEERRWNTSDLRSYLEDPVASRQGERLSEKDRYHEYVMTSLRTMWGIRQDRIEKFSASIREEFTEKAAGELKKGNLIWEDGAYRIPSARRFRTDGIALEFF